MNKRNTAITPATAARMASCDAVRFVHDPEPDYVGIRPEDLRY